MLGEQRAVVVGAEFPAFRALVERAASASELPIVQRVAYYRKGPTLWLSSAQPGRASIDLALSQIVPYAELGDRILLVIDGSRLDQEQIEALERLERRPLSLLIYRSPEGLSERLARRVKTLVDLDLDAPSPEPVGQIDGTALYGVSPEHHPFERRVSAEIGSWLERGEPGALLISGEIGIGKSAALWTALQRWAHSFPGGVAWWPVGGGSPEETAAELRSWMWPVGDSRRWLRGRLRAEQRMLIVLDGVSDPEPFLAPDSPLRGRTASLICTSRCSRSVPGTERIRVRGLTRHRTKKYLQARGWTLEEAAIKLAAGHPLALESLSLMPAGLEPSAWLAGDEAPLGRALAAAWSALDRAARADLEIAVSCPTKAALLGGPADAFAHDRGIGAIPRGLLPTLDRGGAGFSSTWGGMSEHRVPPAIRRWLAPRVDASTALSALAERLVEQLGAGPWGDEWALCYGLDAGIDGAESRNKLRLSRYLFDRLAAASDPGLRARRLVLGLAAAHYLALFAPPGRARALFEALLPLSSDGEADEIVAWLTDLDLREGTPGALERARGRLGALGSSALARISEGRILSEIGEPERAARALRVGLKALGDGGWRWRRAGLLALLDCAEPDERGALLERLEREISQRPTASRAEAMLRDYERVLARWSGIWATRDKAALNEELRGCMDTLDKLLSGDAAGGRWAPDLIGPLQWHLERVSLSVLLWLDLLDDALIIEGREDSLAGAYDELSRSREILDVLAQRGLPDEQLRVPRFYVGLLLAVVLRRQGFQEVAAELLKERLGDREALGGLGEEFWARVELELAMALYQEHITSGRRAPLERAIAVTKGALASLYGRGGARDRGEAQALLQTLEGGGP